MKKLFAGLLFALWFAVPASAQTARVVPACGTLPQSYASGSTRDLTQDVNGNACIAGSFSQTGGTVSNATDAQATTATNQGSVSYNYGFNGTTWDRLQVDASKFLKVNCTVGCSGGTFNNNADAVATSAANGQVAAWLYGFNGATYDRLQVDGSKQLKVADVNVVAAINSPTPAGTNRIGYVTDDPCNNASAKVYTPVNVVTATNVIIAGVAAKKKYLCGIFLYPGGADNVAIYQATTGTSCATAQVAIVGGTTTATGFVMTAQAGFAVGNGSAAFAATTVVNTDICITTSAAVQLSGSVVTADQ
jgi:hypothetical protein